MIGYGIWTCRIYDKEMRSAIPVQLFLTEIQKYSILKQSSKTRLRGLGPKNHQYEVFVCLKSLSFCLVFILDYLDCFSIKDKVLTVLLE